MKKNILLVDDEPLVTQGIQRSLMDYQSHWDIHHAHSVDEAWARMQSESYDTVLLDFNMPKKDGFVLLDMIRNSESSREIPVIILTGRKEHDMKRRAMELGAIDLLNKPIDKEDLIARIRSALQLKSYQDELKSRALFLDFKVKERTAELEASRREIIWRLGMAAEYRNEETGQHILRVGYFSTLIAEELKMTRKYAETILLAAPLHDIGKIGIPDAILLKPGTLTEEEWAIMKTHCRIGAQLLRESPQRPDLFRQKNREEMEFIPIENPILRMASEIALTHHEKWDGSGYPNQLAGDAIPLPGRIVSLIDVYDALRSERPYKPAFSEEITVQMMMEQVGRHFDPMVFDAFTKKREEIDSMYELHSHQEEHGHPNLQKELANIRI